MNLSVERAKLGPVQPDGIRVNKDTSDVVNLLVMAGILVAGVIGTLYLLVSAPFRKRV